MESGEAAACYCRAAILEHKMASDVVFDIQERSSVICTPWNLVPLTLSTAAALMVSGGAVILYSKVDDNFFGLTHVEEVIAVITPLRPCD
ncbi:uncharacterized, partial [Tachysurus ichikawai]